MSKLFIIGNGFDCYLHKLPTQYSDFRKYILEKYPDAKDYYFIPESTLMLDGDEKYDEEESAGYIVNITDYCSGENWSNLEFYLGDGIYDAFTEDLPTVNIEDEDNAIAHDVYTNEDMSKHILNTFAGIRDFFEEWVSVKLGSLDYTGKYSEKVSSILDKDAVYLNFNYTDTLQNLYGIDDENICYIHGRAKDDSEIFFGHGDDEDVPETFETTGTEISFNRLKRELRKDTSKALYNHEDFFKRLSGIDEIYSYGFSFSDVDMIYIEEICRRVNPKKTVWYLGPHDWNNKTECKKKLKEYGFIIKLEDRWPMTSKLYLNNMPVDQVPVISG